VINLAKRYGIPMVVALNKIDREHANPDDLILELANQGIEIDELNGEIPSARISGLTGVGLDILEEKVIKLAKSLKLFEDMNCAA
jgi:translation initiation factor IF-2